MNEATKTKSLLKQEELELLKGKGIDIGCGPDPIQPDCRGFDMPDGDANRITEFVPDRDFDYVFSSHCLEHMHSPTKALDEWWKLVKPGGHMMVVVPHENLYEQGYWPSIFNPDHKATFTISDEASWSPCSHRLDELGSSLPNAQVISCFTQDAFYRHEMLSIGKWPWKMAKMANWFRSGIRHHLPILNTFVDKVFSILRLPIDQTMGEASAQILMVIRKKES